MIQLFPVHLLLFQLQLLQLKTLGACITLTLTTTPTASTIQSTWVLKKQLYHCMQIKSKEADLTITLGPAGPESPLAPSRPLNPYRERRTRINSIQVLHVWFFCFPSWTHESLDSLCVLWCRAVQGFQGNHELPEGKRKETQFIITAQFQLFFMISLRVTRRHQLTWGPEGPRSPARPGLPDSPWEKRKGSAKWYQALFNPNWPLIVNMRIT